MCLFVSKNYRIVLNKLVVYQCLICIPIYISVYSTLNKNRLGHNKIREEKFKKP